jgi:phage terminase large subunit-like protein
VLALRVVFAAAVTVFVVWLLLGGRFAEAIVTVIAAVWVRRVAESGRPARLVRRALPRSGRTV